MDKLRILLIEENRTTRKLIELSLLMDPCIQVISLSSAAAALGALRDGSLKFDAALVDAHAPDMSGVELANRIWALPGKAALKIIFIAASVRPLDIAPYLAQGVLAVIQAPFRPLKIARQVRDLIEQGPCAHDPPEWEIDHRIAQIAC